MKQYAEFFKIIIKIVIWKLFSRKRESVKIHQDSAPHCSVELEELKENPNEKQNFNWREAEG